ncbi:MAG: putrescine ABC transporter permease PotH, partial [Oxalobacteraceae bacterium]
MRRLIRALPGTRWGVIAAPYLWLLVFFAIPFLIVLKISFAERATAMPPYTPLFAVAADGAVSIKLHLGNYLVLLHDSQYLAAYASSI